MVPGTDGLGVVDASGVVLSGVVDASGVVLSGVVDASGVVLAGVVDSAGGVLDGVSGGGTHLVQTVEVLVRVTVEMVLVVSIVVEEPDVTVLVTGQVVNVVTTISVVTIGTVVPGADDAGEVVEASGVVVVPTGVVSSLELELEPGVVDAVSTGDEVVPSVETELETAEVDPVSTGDEVIPAEDDSIGAVVVSMGRLVVPTEEEAGFVVFA